MSRSHTQRPPQVEGISPAAPQLCGLLNDVLLWDNLMELRRERLFDLLAESFLHDATRLATFAAGKAFGLHVGLSGGRHDYLDDSQAAPPT